MRRQILAICGIAIALSCAGSPEPGQLAPCPTGPRPSPEAEQNQLGQASAARGAVLFVRECSRCHSRLVSERASRLFRGYPRFDCPDYQVGVSDQYLHTVISKGGAAVGLDAAMKPFEEKLSADEIADLVAFLRAEGE